jgi:hypothetical protein
VQQGHTAAGRQVRTQPPDDRGHARRDVVEGGDRASLPAVDLAADEAVGAAEALEPGRIDRAAAAILRAA